jgi:signal transduction histidine kinase
MGSQPEQSGTPKLGSVTDSLAGIVSPVLQAAARQVAGDWLSLSAGAADDPELAEKLLGLARAIEADEGIPKWKSYRTAGSTVLRRLLELLRTEVVRIWAASDPPPPPAEMLGLLGGFERTRAALEPAEEHLFASHLAGPGGLELAVEVAHNLRSPLTSVLFLSETLLRGQSGKVNDLQHRQLGLIYSATLGLVSTVSDVIELAHGGQSLMEKHPSTFSVSEMLESICDMVRPMAEEKKLELRTLVPPSDRRLGYPTAISRVLLNLTTNALKFTEKGFVEIATRGTSASQVEFSVRDTGNGLGSATQHELYEPFRRTSSKGGYGFSGSGLGLVICRRLVKAMQSELQYESTPGKGTRFFFEVNLPAVTSS